MNIKRECDKYYTLKYNIRLPFLRGNHYTLKKHERHRKESVRSYVARIEIDIMQVI